MPETTDKVRQTVTKLLILSLERFGPLSEDDKRVLEAAFSGEREVGADQDIAHEGERPTDCKLILDGFVSRYRVLPDGKRQIMNFLISGDIPDLEGFLLQELDHSIGSLTPCKLAIIPHARLREITEMRPRIAHALWQSTQVEAALFRAWMTNIGRQDAYHRVAHLFCELLLRLKAVGLAHNGSYELPVTQAELGDALGLSTVHVNRTLQQLRSNGLIASKGATLVIQDWEGLKQTGQFNPNYLHLRHGEEERISPA